MKPIDSNNIDEIMFALLEGEIQGDERDRLLEAIEADPEYKKLWRMWQNTVLNPDESVGMNTASLLKKERKKGIIVPFRIIRYSAAAAIVLSVGIYFLANTGDQSDDLVNSAKEPVKINNSALPVPKPSVNLVVPADQTSVDSVKPLKEKIKNMALDQPSENPQPAFRNQENLQEISTPVVPPNIPVFAHNENETTINQASPASPSAVSDIQVTVTSYENPIQETKSKKSLLGKVFGNLKVKIENDSNTITKRKLVIDNDKYQIIAGF